MDQVIPVGDNVGAGERKVIFFSCSTSEPETCALVAELEIGVGGGGVGTLPRSILNGLDAVGKRWGDAGSHVVISRPPSESKFDASEVPGVGRSWLGSVGFSSFY